MNKISYIGTDDSLSSEYENNDLDLNKDISYFSDEENIVEKMKIILSFLTFKALKNS